MDTRNGRVLSGRRGRTTDFQMGTLNMTVKNVATSKKQAKKIIN